MPAMCTATNNDYSGGLCVLTNTDCTGTMNCSKALDKVVRSFGWVDVWETVPSRAVYTFYTSHGAARLDGIYVTSNLSGRKVGVETMIAAFIDHLAVCLRVNLEAPLLQRGRGQWQMKTKLVEDTTMRSRFQPVWTGWRLQEKITRT